MNNLAAEITNILLCSLKSSKRKYVSWIKKCLAAEIKPSWNAKKPDGGFAESMEAKYNPTKKTHYADCHITACRTDSSGLRRPSVEGSPGRKELALVRRLVTHRKGLGRRGLQSSRITGDRRGVSPSCYIKLILELWNCSAGLESH